MDSGSFFMQKSGRSRFLWFSGSVAHVVKILLPGGDHAQLFSGELLQVFRVFRALQCSLKRCIFQALLGELVLKRVAFGLCRGDPVLHPQHLHPYDDEQQRNQQESERAAAPCCLCRHR